VTESTTGIRTVLSHPRAYELWSRMVGSERGRRILVREHVRPWPGARLLDFGCGPGGLLKHLGDVRYVGVDISARYIAQAKRQYGECAEFRVGDVTALDADLRDFDIVIAFGVLHHLDDDEAGRVFANAASALASSGRVVTVDPALAPQQPWLARRLILWDRGNHPRGEAEYARIAETALADVRTTLRGDLLRVPYSHCIVEATPA
jgi:SAM-dependent methyltransferase